MPNILTNWMEILPLAKTLDLNLQCKRKKIVFVGCSGVPNHFMNYLIQYHYPLNCWFPLLIWLGNFNFYCWYILSLLFHHYHLRFQFCFHLYLCSLLFSIYHFISIFHLFFLGIFYLLLISSVNLFFAVYFSIIATISIGCDSSHTCARAGIFSICVFSHSTFDSTIYLAWRFVISKRISNRA